MGNNGFIITHYGLDQLGDVIYFFTGTAAGTSNGHEPTSAYQGSSWGLLVLELPWGYGLGGRGGQGCRREPDKCTQIKTE